MSTSPRSRSNQLIAGRYVPLERVGSGQYGTVYRVEDSHAGDDRPRELALKVLRRDSVSEEAIARLEEEFRVFASLRHEHIARAFDFGYDGRLPYYTREFVAGASLAPGPPRGVTARAWLQPLLDVLEALEYVHRVGLLHLDVHAGNVIESVDGGGVLIDFGFGASRAALGTLSRSGVPLPPELATGSGVGPATDVHLAGRLLLHRLHGEDATSARLAGEIADWGIRMSRDLERIAAKSLAARPTDRFVSAGDFFRALSDALGVAAAVQPGARPDRLLGRTGDVDWIVSALRALADGESRGACFSAEPGMGKTRILDEVRTRAQIAGVRTVAVSFRPDHDGPSPLVARLRSLPASERAWLDALDPAFGGTPENRARCAAQSFFAEAGPPLAIVLDDVEFADPASRRLILAVLAEARRGGARAIGIFMSSRDAGDGDGMARAIGRGGRGSPFCLRRIGPLARADAIALLREELSGIETSSALLRRAVRAARRCPRDIARIAQILRRTWREARVVPDEASLPRLSGDAEIDPRVSGDPLALDVIRVLAVAGRALEVAELEELPEISSGKELRRVIGLLVRTDAIESEPRGRRRAYRLTSPRIADELVGTVAPPVRRRWHRALLSRLERDDASDGRAWIARARHALACSAGARARLAAMRAAEAAPLEGLHDAALDVLGEVRAAETDGRRAFELLEHECSVLEATGDHARGVETLRRFEPLAETLDRVTRCRYWRMRGVHAHRAGDAVSAMECFDRSRALASGDESLEDLILIDCELAEIGVYRGDYANAEDACRRGLARLERIPRSPTRAVREPSEVVLRASLGHLELRRMRLDRAREELRSALAAGEEGRASPGLLAVILNNLGIAERQSGRFAEAESCLRRAERILLRAGEGASLVKIACNLALSAAHRVDRGEAEAELSRAERLCGAWRSDRLEFFVRFTRGIVAHAFGDAREARTLLDEAVRRGRRLGDSHLASFGALHLADAHLLAGEYDRALATLGSIDRRTADPSGALRDRMLESRRALLHALCGRTKAARLALARLEALPPSPAPLPERMSAFMATIAAILLGDDVSAALDSLGAEFECSGLSAGARLASVARLAVALHEDDRAAVRALAGSVARNHGEGTDHELLAVLEPLVLGEAWERLGDLDNAESFVDLADAALLGRPLLELELRIELVRARIRRRRGQRDAARRHLHRAARARDHLEELAPVAVRASLRSASRFRELDALESALARTPRLLTGTSSATGPIEYAGIVGRSAALRRIVRVIDGLRGADLPVLIQGESGTGKDVVARAIHRTGDRARRPFVAVHCPSIPDPLFEAELFGCVAGAFTGAERDRDGLIAAAAGGTLYLDAVDELSDVGQTALSRVLGAARYRPVGSTGERDVDVRIVASSTRDIRGDLLGARFRPELFFRLAAVELVLPPLRERVEDIVPLARHFLASATLREGREAPDLSAEARVWLSTRDWRGNARELEALVVATMVVHADARVLEVAHFEPSPDAARGPVVFSRELLQARGIDELRDELERAYVIEVLRETGGDFDAVRRAFGCGRTQLYALFRRLGLDARELRRRFDR